jgi:hypothetical protein
MEVIDRINECETDEQLECLARELIKEAIDEVEGMNTYQGLIGLKSEVNKKNVNFDFENSKRYSYSVPFWDGYVPLGTKIVYGNATDKTFNYDCNCGFYYYVDDESYIYDFVKYIKKYKIEDCFDLVSIINNYCIKLFENHFKRKDRMIMNRLLLKNNNEFFDPIKEHSIKDFYGNDSAKCTEYALIASNLLSVFKVPAYYCMDNTHAYNVFFDETEDEFYEGYILDYSNCVWIYDIQFNTAKRFPFFSKIKIKEKKYILLPNDEVKEIEEDDENKEEEFNQFYYDFVNGGKRIEMDDCIGVMINGHLFKADIAKKRNYGVECNQIKNKELILKR